MHVNLLRLSENAQEEITFSTDNKILREQNKKGKMNHFTLSVNLVKGVLSISKYYNA